MAEAKPSKTFSVDVKAVRTLANILKETDLTEIEYELENSRIRVVRNSASLPIISHNIPAPTIIASSPSLETSLTDIKKEDISNQGAQDWTMHSGVIKSPLVGTAYLTPQPGSPPFIKEGDVINEGQTLMIIEAMKVMNPIKAVKAGKVLKILIENAHPVEYGEPLVVIG